MTLGWVKAISLVGACALVLMTAAGLDGPAPQHSVEYGSLVADGASPVSSENSLPDDIAPGLQLDQRTARYFGTVEQRQFWVAESSRGLVCLVEYSQDSGALTGCTTPPRFYREGTALAREDGFTAFLAPDGVDTSPLAAAWRDTGVAKAQTLGTHAELVVTSSGAAARAGAVTLPRTGGPSLTFHPLLPSGPSTATGGK